MKNIIKLNGKSYQEGNIIILPTENESPICKVIEDFIIESSDDECVDEFYKGDTILYYKDIYESLKFENELHKLKNIQFQHIYVTSNEEIKKGDRGYVIFEKVWGVPNRNIKVVEVTGHYQKTIKHNKEYVTKSGTINISDCSGKIIASTDLSLLLPDISFKEWDGKSRNLPQLSKQFINDLIINWNNGNKTGTDKLFNINKVLIEVERDLLLYNAAKLELNSNYGNRNLAKTREQIDALYKLSHIYNIKLNPDRSINIIFQDGNIGHQNEEICNTCELINNSKIKDDKKEIIDFSYKIDSDSITLYGAGKFHEEKLVLDKIKASLLFIELWKFLDFDKEDKKPKYSKKEIDEKLIYCVSEIAAKLGYAKTSQQMKVWNEETLKWISENIY